LSAGWPGSPPSFDGFSWQRRGGLSSATGCSRPPATLTLQLRQRLGLVLDPLAVELHLEARRRGIEENLRALGVETLPVVNFRLMRDTEPDAFFDDQVGAEDTALVEAVHRGMRSGLVEHGRLLLSSEALVHAFQRWLAGRLDDVLEHDPERLAVERDGAA